MSQSTVLALFFGRDDIPYQHTWEGAGGATRSYAGFAAMANEQERARVWGGIHFTYDNVAGQYRTLSLKQRSLGASSRNPPELINF